MEKSGVEKALGGLRLSFASHSQMRYVHRLCWEAASTAGRNQAVSARCGLSGPLLPKAVGKITEGGRGEEFWSASRIIGVIWYKCSSISPTPRITMSGWGLGPGNLHSKWQLWQFRCRGAKTSTVGITKGLYLFLRSAVGGRVQLKIETLCQKKD